MCVAYRSDEVGRCETAGCTPLTRVITLLCVGLLFCILGVVSYTTFAPILEQQVKAVSRTLVYLAESLRGLCSIGNLRSSTELLTNGRIQS